MIEDSTQPPEFPFQKAVAVQSRQQSALPVITASGRGKFAEKILDIAFEHDVKVRQDGDLTDLLEQFEVDSPIPLEALGAITEVLRYVYQLNGKMAEEN